jgi:hypothetical protein
MRLGLLRLAEALQFDDLVGNLGVPESPIARAARSVGQSRSE